MIMIMIIIMMTYQIEIPPRERNRSKKRPINCKYTDVTRIRATGVSHRVFISSAGDLFVYVIILPGTTD